QGRLFSLDKEGGVQIGAHSDPLVDACRHRRSIRYRNELLPARGLGHWASVVEEFGRRHQRASLRGDEPRSDPTSAPSGGTLETDRAALSQSAQESYVRAAERAARPTRRWALAGGVSHAAQGHS